MQVDGTTFGIIPDTFNTILSNYLTSLQNTFPNANSIDDPIYALAYVISTQDVLLQAALTSLWNSINANTAQGLGLDILSSTVLNLTRKSLVPSSCVVYVTIGPIYSTMTVQVTVTAVTGTVTIPTNWTVTGTASPSPNYKYVGTGFSIAATGVYYIPVQSTDTSTPIPASSINSADAVSGLTFTVTNPQAATLGSVTIPTTYQVTASSLGANSPIYSPNSPETYKTAGIYSFIVYSTNIVTPISASQLNTSSDSTGSLPYLSYITKVTNPNDALLGTPEETDAQFNARRRYYLNVEGQTYYGLEKAILDLNTPALQSVFIAETISDNTKSLSMLIVKVSITLASGSVVLPVGWTVYGSASPSPNYATLQAYTFSTIGTYDEYIPVYSTDFSTPIGIGTINSADAPFGSTVTAVTNLDPAILNPNVTLGQRGYTVYLEYPTVPYSLCTITLTVSAIGGSPPYYIPIGWQATGFSTTSPYVTQDSYKISATGTYSINVYSTDVTTAVPASSFTGGSAVSGLTFTVTNLSAAILGGPNPGGFDTNDLYLQQIAATCFAYHPLGTQFYAASVGPTTFTVNTPYAGYTSNVILNPFQIEQISCNLKLIYNSDPNDAGFSNGVFDVSLLPNLQTNIQEIINEYFLSKTLPTDLVYTINELSEIIQKAYVGIVALVGNGSTIFSFGTLTPSIVTGLVYLRRPIGFNYNLSTINFNFSAVDKDSL